MDLAARFVGHPSRALWLEPGQARQALLFLDGELYRERVGAPAIVDRLRAGGELTDTRCAFLDAGDGAARHADFTCSDDYTAFLSAQVLGILDAPVLLVGLSLSGLAAAYAAVERPDLFPAVICQSPSAWWNNEWLARQLLSGRDLSASRFWISVGDRELEAGVSHPPSGMYQGNSQLGSCCRLCRRLRGCCATVQHPVYQGGHDPACWAAELPAALHWIGARS